MSLQKFNPRFLLLIVFMLVVAALRISNAAQVTPWANFTPIGAMGLFGGAYFNSRWKAFLFPLLTLFLSDLVINTLVFQGKYGVMDSGWYIVYGTFALIVLLGKFIIKNVTIKNVLIAAIAATMTHWCIADFMVWFGGGIDIRTSAPLSKDVAGLLQSYVQGFPFMKNFLLGTLVYSGIMFGAFEWMKAKNTALQPNYI